MFREPVERDPTASIEQANRNRFVSERKRLREKIDELRRMRAQIEKQVYHDHNNNNDVYYL